MRAKRGNAHMANLQKSVGRLLCLLGLHRFRIVEKTASFGSGGVEKVQYQRCGLAITRQG